jgi:hypothetical protein
MKDRKIPGRRGQTIAPPIPTERASLSRFVKCANDEGKVAPIFYTNPDLQDLEKSQLPKVPISLLYDTEGVKIIIA